MATNLPNWPHKDTRPDSTVTMPASGVSCTTDSPLVTVPQHPTVQSADAAGAVVGTVIAAPLAPESGPINAKPDALVVTRVRKLTDTPTFKAVRAVFISAIGIVFLTFGASCMSVWSSGKSLFDAGAIDWRNTERACEIAGGGALVGGLMMLMKGKDNTVTT